jgi:murein tripeptide amidase MpaA
LDLNRYFDNETLELIMDTWVKEYPDLVSLAQLGSSYAKRPIWLLTITNQKTGPDNEKPALWIDANIHATEIAGTTAVLKIAENFLAGYNQDPHLKKILDTRTLYLVPRINPDGAALAMSDSPEYIRSGVRPYPYAEKTTGLHPADIDGDGRILQMRIPDPNGDWKISSLDPRLMEKRAPVEFGGTYYRLLTEGNIEKFDGFTIKAAQPYQGLDFNRNFPFEWRTEADQSGAGPYPGSEPEIKALLDFIINHPNINIAITFHTYSRVILRPYSTKADDEMEPEDLWLMKKIGAIGTRLTGYRCVSTFHDFKFHPKEVTTGAFDDWMYDHLGVISYTIELWDLPTEAGIKDRNLIEWGREHPHEEDLQILHWIEKNSPEDSYINWYPCRHPQLGIIELGGWNSMYTWRNPPAALIGAEADKHIPFMVALADLLPNLTIHRLEGIKIQENTYHVRLVVENTGFLPTYTSQQGKKRKAIRPVRVELMLPPNTHLISGKMNQEIDQLEGRSNKLSVSAHFGYSPTDNRGMVEWTIQAPAGTEIPIKIISERAGTLRQILPLP